MYAGLPDPRICPMPRIPAGNRGLGAPSWQVLSELGWQGQRSCRTYRIVEGVVSVEEWGCFIVERFAH